MSATTFRPGETLVVEPKDEPKDDNDPFALAHQGEHCTFVRYRESPVLFGYALVKFENLALPVYFRPQDLQRVEVQHEA